jgi:hypothetical protein
VVTADPLGRLLGEAEHVLDEQLGLADGLEHERLDVDVALPHVVGQRVRVGEGLTAQAGVVDPLVLGQVGQVDLVLVGRALAGHEAHVLELDVAEERVAVHELDPGGVRDAVAGPVDPEVAGRHQSCER